MRPAGPRRHPGRYLAAFAPSRRRARCGAIGAGSRGGVWCALAGAALELAAHAARGRRVQCTHTAPVYKLYALDSGGAPVKRPGLVKVGPDEGGAAIEVEVWELPVQHFGSFVAGIPAPLGIGTTVLADGRTVPGFICEPDGLRGATDITAYGGWRAWLSRPQ